MTAKIIDGKAIGQQIRTKVKQQIDSLIQQTEIKPCVTSIIIGNDPASELYLNLREKACNSVGISHQRRSFPKDVTEHALLQEIEKLNADASVHGILVQLPLPTHIQPFQVMEQLHPNKDVEGFHPCNMGKTLIGDEFLVPCTPKAVLSILDHEGIELKGKNVVILNHSVVVGKPLSVILLKRDATVSVCHVFTKDIRQFTKQADIVISAAGVAGLITSDHVKEGAILIDVSINNTKSGITGDVNVDSIKDTVQAYTPVPGGVGPVTIACSLQNILTTFRLCNHH